MQGFFFNFCFDKFQDLDVCCVLNYVYDFEMINEIVLVNFLKWVNFYFVGIELVFFGLLEGKELEIFEEVWDMVLLELFM